MSLKRIIRKGLVSILLATALTMGCGEQKVSKCKYEEPNETLVEKTNRLGNNDKCLEIIPGHNDIREKRINIVFSGVNYTKEDLSQLVKQGIGCIGEKEGLLGTEPFNSNATNFNFWYAPEPENVDLGNKNGDTTYLLGIKAASPCNLPRKTIIILANWDFTPKATFSLFNYLNLHEMDLNKIGEIQNQLKDESLLNCRNAVSNSCGFDIPDHGHYTKICNAIEKLRGSQDKSLDENICEIIFEENIRFGLAKIPDGALSAIPHELGHAIWGLNDEYVAPEKIKKELSEYLKTMKINGVNCYAEETKEKCIENAPWSKMIKDCYQGCGYAMEAAGVPLWRSIDKGMMGVSMDNPLGKWNESIACNVIHVATQNAKGVCGKK